MSKNLILDWQKNSLMLARASGRAPKALVEDVIVKSVGGTDVDSQTAAEALRAAAQELSVKGEVTVLVARDLVEMRTVQIPKMDPDDLPDVIRFQAQRQFASMSDAWTVDYVLLPPASGSEMLTALVAAISPAQLSEIDSACSAAGLQATKISLRPVQTAQFAVDGGLIPSSGQSAVICISESTVDILIVREGKVVQVRTTKLPSESDQVAAALQGELRRSLFAASAELDGKSIENVLLVATANRSGELAKVIEPVFNCRVVQFHPETLLADANIAVADTTANRLTAAAGSLTLDAASCSSVINFKNPKKRPPKKRDTRKYLLPAAAAASVLMLGIGWYYSTVNDLDAQYNAAQDEIKSLKALADANQKRLAEMNAIQQFAQGSPNWLDELAYLSEKVPNSDKVMLDSPTFTLANNGVGEIKFNLLSTDKSGVSEFQDALHNPPNYKVATRSTGPLPKPEGKYQYQSVGSTISIVNKGWDLNAPPSEIVETFPAKTEERKRSDPPSGAGGEPSRSRSRTDGPSSGSGFRPGSFPGRPSPTAQPPSAKPTNEPQAPAGAAPASGGQPSTEAKESKPDTAEPTTNSTNQPAATENTNGESKPESKPDAGPKA
ncbi:MAG: hypothetical protein U0930_23935 [Pirellulales bacterium]